MDSYLEARNFKRYRWLRGHRRLVYRGLSQRAHTSDDGHTISEFCESYRLDESIVMNPKGSLPLIVGIVGILLLFLIFRGMASGEITAAMKKMVVTPGQGKFVSGGIWAATILFFGAIAAAVISEVRGLFK